MVFFYSLQKHKVEQEKSQATQLNGGPRYADILKFIHHTVYL